MSGGLAAHDQADQFIRSRCGSTSRMPDQCAPSRSTAARSAMRKISSSRWRDIDHARRPCRAAGRNAWNRRSTSSAGKLAVGSSSTRKSQSTARARAIATSDFSVRVRSPTLRCRVEPHNPRCASASAATVSSAERQSISPRFNENPCAQRHVLGDGHPVDQPQILVNECNGLPRASTRPGMWANRARRRSELRPSSAACESRPGS